MSDNNISLVPKIKSIITKKINYIPLDIHWLPFSTKLVTIGETFNSKGILQIYNLCQGRLSLENEYIHNFPCKCSSFSTYSFSSRDLALGDFKGNLSIFDLERGIKNYEIKNAHKGIIQSIDGSGIKNNQGPSEVITGGKDSLVKLWDLRSDKPSVILEPKDIKQNFPECWTVKYGDCGLGKTIGIGYDNGDVKIFDLRMDKLFYRENLKSGICYIEFDTKNKNPSNKMIVTTLNSKLYLYDLSNLENNKKLCNEVNTTIWGAKFFPHERDIFVSLGGDGNINFYNYDKNLFINNNNDKLNVVAYNNICSSPIIGFDWHLIKNGLACLISLDNTVRICKCENF